MAMAVEVTEAAAMVATDVADTARGLLMPSLRPMPSSMEDTTATVLPSPTPAMPMPPPMLMPTGMLPPTPMALLAMLLPTLLVATPTSGRGRLRPSLAMATDVVAMVAVAMVAMDVADTARGRLRPAMATAVEAMVDAAMVATDVADTTVELM